MEKRVWCYILKPVAFDIRCDRCWEGDLSDGTGKNITWSEYESRIWCYDCKIDTEGFRGVFDGPIPIHVSYMLGLNFDRVILTTGEIERFNLHTMNWDSQVEVAKNIDNKTFTKALLKDKEVEDPYGILLRRAGREIFGRGENNNIFIKDKGNEQT